MTTDTHQHTARCWWNPDQVRWVCRDGSTKTGAAPADNVFDLPLVDVRDMIIVHTAILREVRLAPAAVTRTAPGDRTQARVVAAHILLLCDLLHHHHAGEDELLWPKLRERTPAAKHGVIDEVEAQHDEIDAVLTRVGQLRESWAEQATLIDRDLLATVLSTLHALLSEHLDLEERELLPLAAGALTEAEWDAIGAAAVAATPKPALLLAFGMFAYEGDPAVLRDMLKTVSSPPRFLIVRLAPRLYLRRARRVHGVSRP